jgi:membrane dipeptidase
VGFISDSDAGRLELGERARKLHTRAIVIDLHVDSIIQQRLFGYDLRKEHRPGPIWSLKALPFELVRWAVWAVGYEAPFFNHADIPRMVRAGYNAVGLGIHYWPRQRESGWKEINKQIDYFTTLLESDPGVVLARGPDDVRRAAAEGQLAAFFCIEGLHALGAGGKKTERERLDRLEKLVERGVRYVTFAHFSKNDAAPHCFGPGGALGRLTDFGRHVVRKMNEVGLIIDVSHVSEPALLDICELSARPVIASHTGFAGVDPQRQDAMNARNLSDRALMAIVETGGLAGVMAAPQFLSGGRDGVRAMARHLGHAERIISQSGRIGSRHLAVGSDLDGWIAHLPQEMRDVTDMPLLTKAMLAHGFSDEQVLDIWGESFLRVWADVLQC